MAASGEGDPADREPPTDYQLTQAAERTYLAYVRTSLALLASGVAAVGALPNAGQLQLRRVIGVLLVLGGLSVTLLSRRRWLAVEGAMRRREPLPHTVVPLLLTGTLLSVGALALVLVVLI
jgi:putative membrane protein